LQVWGEAILGGLPPGCEHCEFCAANVLAEGRADFGGHQDGGELAGVCELLSQGHHGGGFSRLAWGVDDEIVLLGDQALKVGEPRCGRQRVVDRLAAGACSVKGAHGQYLHA
jgi:hypothetical protein